MARDADDFLGLLECGEIEEVNLQVLFIALDAVLLLVANLRDATFDGIAFNEYFIDAVKVTACDEPVGLFEEFVNRIADGNELIDVGLRHGIEVVVHVFQARFKHAFETVDDLRDAVASEVEPGVFLHSLHVVNLSHAEDFFSSVAFPDSFFFINFVVCGAQFLHVVVHESLADVPEGRAGEDEDIALSGSNVSGKEFPNHGFVVCADNLAEERVHSFFFAFLFEPAVVADDDKCHECDHEHHGDDSSEVVEHGDEEADDEGCAGGDEPSTDDGDDAGDAIDCCFASPSPVCERRTHGNHEGDVGGGEGETEGGTDDDEQTRQDEVDGSTNFVEGGSFFKHDGFLFESFVNPVGEALRNETVHGGGDGQHASHGSSCDFGGTENFFSFVLA